MKHVFVAHRRTAMPLGIAAGFVCCIGAMTHAASVDPILQRRRPDRLDVAADLLLTLVQHDLGTEERISM